MTPVMAALCAFLVYFLGYRVYSRFLATRLFELDATRITPAHRLEDGVDYVPTKPSMLFGHHYASITGLAPMLGPAIAVIWGWVPAMIWVVFGAVLIGCVHDFSALVLSSRARGVSVGTVAKGVISPRARWLFLCIIFFGIALAMGVFVFVIAKLFGVYLVPPSEDGSSPGMEGYPQSVLPSAVLMVIALVSGYLLKKKQAPFRPVIAIGFMLSLVAIWCGLALKQQGVYGDWWPASDRWIIILLVYAFAASVLPVWTLLQPRDFLNSLLLYLGLGLAYVGLFALNPQFDAPAFDPNPAGAPPMLPFVFILIACGAASGFHGLVSSGTTAKQLDKETDARPIGYGAMVGESLLGLLAVLACTAGFGSSHVWHTHYASFHAAAGLAVKLRGFIDGTTAFLSALGLPSELASAIIAMVVVSFALTTLDSATRLLRFNIEELFGSIGGAFIRNRYVSSFAAVLVIAFFAFYKVEVVVNGVVAIKPAALALWALFGTTNQLLAGLTLVMVTLYLKHRGKPILYTGIPAVFIMGSTVVSMGLNLKRFLGGTRPDYLLGGVGLILMSLGVWLVVEATLALRRSTETTEMVIDLDE
ncbi:MAG: carbon starvation protein A [Myxococcota bacterium]|nr:carbon starvation protein A [Myxococcota bacterium]